MPGPHYSHKKLEKLKEDHSKDAIAARLDRGPKPSYLKDLVYGAIDGTVTTFALVAGVAGAGLEHSIVLILGFANLFGDGFSMAASNFLGSKTEKEQLEAARKEEHKHIKLFPEGEREEIRQLFAQKGFQGQELEQVVDVITADVDRWVDTMLQEELGLRVQPVNPLRAALSTFVAFFLVGLIPLVPFLYQYATAMPLKEPFLISGLMTALTFFVVGLVKGKVISERLLLSGLETLAVGGGAATLAYLIGYFLGKFN